MVVWIRSIFLGIKYKQLFFCWQCCVDMLWSLQKCRLARTNTSLKLGFERFSPWTTSSSISTSRLQLSCDFCILIRLCTASPEILYFLSRMVSQNKVSSLTFGHGFVGQVPNRSSLSCLQTSCLFLCTGTEGEYA